MRSKRPLQGSWPVTGAISGLACAEVGPVSRIGRSPTAPQLSVRGGHPCVTLAPAAGSDVAQVHLGPQFASLTSLWTRAPATVASKQSRSAS